MGARVVVGLLLAVISVAATGWLAGRADLPAWTSASAAVAAGLVAAFAPTVADTLLRTGRDRRQARRLAGAVAEQVPEGTVAGLLRADQRVVPFTGREHELGELREWCRDRKPPVRLLVGEGGVGKTRIAVELSHYLANLTHTDWTVSSVAPGREPDALHQMRSHHRGQLLLVVDYAETRSGLAELLRSVAEDPANVRVLLIARGVGDWWRKLGGDIAAVRRMVDAYPPMTLTSALDPTKLPAGTKPSVGTKPSAGTDPSVGTKPSAGTEPARLVRAAIPHFARRLGMPVPPGLAAAEVSVPEQVPLLVLHAAALVAVLRSASTEPRTTPLVVDSAVLAELLGHEARYWTAHRGLAADETVRRRAVAVACLFPAEDEQEAAELLRRIPELAGEDALRHQLARWLRELYPTDSGHWGYLQPELVSEHHVIEQVRECPALVCTDPGALREPQRHQMLTVLSLATAHRPGDQQILERLLREELAVLWRTALAVATASGGGLRPVLFRVLATSALPVSVLGEIDRAIPSPTTQLAATAVAVARRLLRALPADAEPGQVAQHLARLGVLEAQAGRTRAARRHLEMAVLRYRELARLDYPGHAPELARCQHLRALRYAEEGRPEAARSSAEEAAAQFRAIPELAGGYQPDLAACLHNLGVWTIEPERRAEAALLLDEAVRTYRELAEQDRNRYLGALHEALESQRRCRATLPAPQPEPLANLVEAVQHYHNLALAEPDQYGAELAHALHLLGDRYVAYRRFAEAQATLAEAVTIYRRFTGDDPDRSRYRLELANSLNDLGVVLTELGRFAEAEHSIRDAIDRFQRLTAADPPRYRAELAKALDNLVVALARAGQPTEALEPAEEAVRQHRRLADLDPKRATPDLARSLTNHGVCLSELRRHYEALSITEEAVRHYRGLHETEPGHYAPRLAHALENLAVDYAALRRHPEADDCRTRAAALRSNTPAPLAPTPDAPTPDAPTPDAPTPDAPTPDVPTPDVPARNVPAAGDRR